MTVYMEKVRGIYMTSNNSVILNNQKLQEMLKAARRFSYINGTKQPQCHACVIICDQNSDKATIVSTVKDGVSSVHELQMDCEAGGFLHIVVADIADMLGVLKTHSDEITITVDKIGDNLIIKSSNKKTVLRSSALCRAYPSSRQTAIEQMGKAESIILKIDKTNRTYTDSNGKKHTPLTGDYSRDVLVEAFKSANVNGQSVARYLLHNSDNNTHITTGVSLRGKTSTMISFAAFPYNIEFGGGLEEVLTYFDKTIILSIYDMRDYGGGFILLFQDGRNMVMQVGVSVAN